MRVGRYGLCTLTLGIWNEIQNLLAGKARSANVLAQVFCLQHCVVWVCGVAISVLEVGMSFKITQCMNRFEVVALEKLDETAQKILLLSLQEWIKNQKAGDE